MKFTIKNTTIQAGAPPAAVMRMREYLDKLPDGELLPYEELMARLRVSQCYLLRGKRHPLLADYWTLGLVGSSHTILFGNPRTIAAYIKEFLT